MVSLEWVDRLRGVICCGGSWYRDRRVRSCGLRVRPGTHISQHRRPQSACRPTITCPKRSSTSPAHTARLHTSVPLTVCSRGVLQLTTHAEVWAVGGPPCNAPVVAGVGMAGAGAGRTRRGASRVLHPPATSAALQRQLDFSPNSGARTPLLCSPAVRVDCMGLTWTHGPPCLLLALPCLTRGELGNVCADVGEMQLLRPLHQQHALRSHAPEPSL
jgi:hypothetical protein